MPTTDASTLNLPPISLRAIGSAVLSRAPDAGPAILRAGGVEIGRELIEGLADDLSLLSTDDFWNQLANGLDESGWGRFTFDRPHPGVGLLESEDCAEADSGADRQHPACHLTTGVLAAMLERAGDASLSVLEVTCRSAGDERCRFGFGGSEALGRLHRALAEGDTFEGALQRLETQD